MHRVCAFAHALHGISNRAGQTTNVFGVNRLNHSFISQVSRLGQGVHMIMRAFKE